MVGFTYTVKQLLYFTPGIAALKWVLKYFPVDRGSTSALSYMGVNLGYFSGVTPDFY